MKNLRHNLEGKSKKENESGESIPEHWSFRYFCTSIPSTPPKPKPQGHKGIQTLRIETSEAETQMKNETVQTQTNELQTLDDGMKEYPQSLCDFMAKVTPFLCQELESNVHPDEILIFKQLMEERRKPEPVVEIRSEASKLLSFKNFAAVQSDRQFVRMSWSPSGIYLIASYATAKHDLVWCHHQTNLALYNIRKLDPTNTFVKPDRDFTELEYCVSALEFHPTCGSLLAAGTINGCVILMDLMSGSDLEMESVKNDTCHTDMIVGIEWITLTSSQVKSRNWTNKDCSNNFLITASKDGYIGLWSLGRIKLCLHLEKRLTLLVENILEPILLKSKKSQIVNELGITALTISTSDPSKLIFATFGSFVFTGDVFSSRKINNFASSKFIKDPEVPLHDTNSILISKQVGLIVALESSPFHSDFVLVLSEGGYLALLNIYEREPLLLKFYLGLEMNEKSTGVKWSPHRPMVFGVTIGKTVHIYDLLQSRSIPTLMLDHKYDVHSIQFSAGCPGKLAVSDVEGEISIWELSSNLIKREKNELVQLINIERNFSDITDLYEV